MARTGMVALATMLGACGLIGGGDEPVDKTGGLPTSVPEASEAVRGGEITVAVEAESPSWLPGEIGITNTGRNVAYALYDPLVVVGEDGAIHPYLAESITPNPALTEWTLTLRPNVRFHDGTPLDAMVMQRIFNDFLMAENSSTQGLLDEVAELRVDDELTFTYVLTRPNGGFASVLTGPIGWPFSPNAATSPEVFFGSRIAGTGPFRIESWQPDNQLVVVRNEDYWREGLPYLDRVTFRPVPDEQMRADSLLTGRVDAIQSLRGDSIKATIAAEDRGFTAHVMSGDDASMAILDTTRPPFDDRRVRRATAMMVDLEALIEVLGDDGLVEPSSQFYGVDSPWYSEKVAAARAEHDPDGARALLSEYAYDPDRSDGLPLGTPPNLEFTCITEPTLLEVARVVEDDARAVGFNATTKHVDVANLLTDMQGTPDQDPPFSGNFTAACFRTQTSPDPATTFGTWFGAPDAESGNIANFSTPDLVRLINELRATADPDRQYAIVEEIGVIINEEAPLIFVSATPTMIGVRDEVKNVTGWTTPEGAVGNGIPFGVTRWGEVWLDD